eukprot:1158184-Pelagomonas_calceolata.AAC.2
MHLPVLLIANSTWLRELQRNHNKPHQVQSPLRMHSRRVKITHPIFGSNAQRFPPTMSSWQQQQQDLINLPTHPTLTHTHIYNTHTHADTCTHSYTHNCGGVGRTGPPHHHPHAYAHTHTCGDGGRTGSTTSGRGARLHAQWPAYARPGGG